MAPRFVPTSRGGVSSPFPLSLPGTLLLNDRGVHAKGHVVDEQAVSDGRAVDAALDAVSESAQATPGIISVDAEVESEVVPGSRRDAHERKIVLDGDGGDERLRTVTSGHSETVGTMFNRIRVSAFKSSPWSSMMTSTLRRTR